MTIGISLCMEYHIKLGLRRSWHLAGVDTRIAGTFFKSTSVISTISIISITISSGRIIIREVISMS